jgi:hypothetical protein
VALNRQDDELAGAVFMGVPAMALLVVLAARLDELPTLAEFVASLTNFAYVGLGAGVVLVALAIWLRS